MASCKLKEGCLLCHSCMKRAWKNTGFDSIEQDRGPKSKSSDLIAAATDPISSAY